MASSVRFVLGAPWDKIASHVRFVQGVPWDSLQAKVHSAIKRVSAQCQVPLRADVRSAVSNPCKV